MNVHFEDPPIKEFVIATYFNPPLFALRNEHIGLFWSRIRDKFPKVEQQQPVGGTAAVGAIAQDDEVRPIGNDVFPMPRYWFMSEDQTTVIQLQKNALMLNWRRGAEGYPRFAGYLKPTFDRYYRIFEEFAREEAAVEELKIDLCELAYINVVTPCEYWNGPTDTPHVLPSVGMPDIGFGSSGRPVIVDAAYTYTLDPDLHLRVTVRNAESANDPNVPVLVLEISVRGRLERTEKSNADSWFDRAHEAAVNCFVRMTSDEVRQNQWKSMGNTP